MHSRQFDLDITRAWLVACFFFLTEIQVKRLSKRFQFDKLIVGLPPLFIFCRFLFISLYVQLFCLFG